MFYTHFHSSSSFGLHKARAQNNGERGKPHHATLLPKSQSVVTKYQAFFSFVPPSSFPNRSFLLFCFCDDQPFPMPLFLKLKVG